MKKLRSDTYETTLVWVDKLDEYKVRIVFRSKRDIRTIYTKAINAKCEVAILQETDLANLSLLVHMALGMIPIVQIQSFGAGLNPRLPHSDSGKALFLNMVRGLFVACSRCEEVVCQLNGLCAEVILKDGIYHIRWKEHHQCTDHEYTAIQLKSGIRMA